MREQGYYLINPHDTLVVEDWGESLGDSRGDRMLLIPLQLVLDETANVESALVYVTRLDRDLKWE